MSFKTFWLIIVSLFFIIGCSNKQKTTQLSQQERNAIDSLGLDSLLVLEVKQLTGKEFIKMQGAVQALKKNRITPFIHGITLGFFDIDMNFDETPLKEINEKWKSKGYVVQTLKYDNSNNLQIRTI